MASGTVTVERICELLAGEGREPLTRAAVSQFVADGMPKAARGQYEPVACLSWYIARLKAAADKRKVEGEDGKEVSLDQADIRLKTVKAKLEEMTLAEREGTLIPLELYEQQLAQFTGTVAASLLNLPSRLASKMEGLTTLERKALLTASVRSALGSLAENAHRESSSNNTAKPAPARAKRRSAKVPAKATRKPRNRK